MADQRDAGDTVRSLTRRHAASSGQVERLRAFLLSDSYAFAQIVCGHLDLVPELHMPLSYLACGLTDKLITTLDARGFDSFVTKALRREFWRREIDWTTPEGRAKLDKQLDFVSIRWFRGSYKSSVITHAGGTFMATVNPNITGKITHATDDKAWEFLGQIGDTIQSGVYQDLFPERIPTGNLNELISQKKISLGGRTVSRPQTTLQASGYLTKDIGGHYDLFLIDDLVMERNATPDMLKGVHMWLRNLEGYYIEAPGVRVRRIHVGTKWDEDDDDAYLTRGRNATQCLTIRVPIEEHEGADVVNIMQAGRPTIPQLYPAEKIAEKKARVINGEEDGEDADGARSWRCNYLLDAYAGGVRLFPPSLVDDPERWFRRLPHPKPERHSKGHFLVSRLKRNAEGKVLLDPKGNPAVLTFDPWKDLDIVATVDPSWSDKEGADNWGVSVTGTDYEGVTFQLETLSAASGLDGWIEALCDVDEFYKIRAIGFDGGAYQDAAIQNTMKTDKRLKRLRNRMVKVPHNNRSKIARIREYVSERMKRYALLLDPTEAGQPTRDEMKGYRATGKDKDGILDSLAMAPAVLKKRRSPEDTEKAREQALLRDRDYRNRVNPALGVPMVA